MFLYHFFANYDNFQYIIESHNDLSLSESLYIKIVKKNEKKEK